jgi:hypothetical protein
MKPMAALMVGGMIFNDSRVDSRPGVLRDDERKGLRQNTLQKYAE